MFPKTKEVAGLRNSRLILLILPLAIVFAMYFVGAGSETKVPSNGVGVDLNYKSVNVVVDYDSQSKMNQTVTYEVEAQNLSCFYCNYATSSKDANVEQKILSVSLSHLQEGDVLVPQELKDDGYRYRDANYPDFGVCSYDEQYKMIYLNVRDEDSDTPYTGKFQVIIQTQSENKAGASLGFTEQPSGLIAGLLSTNAKMAVNNLTATIKNVDSLGDFDNVEAYVWNDRNFHLITLPQTVVAEKTGTGEFRFQFDHVDILSSVNFAMIRDSASIPLIDFGGNLDRMDILFGCNQVTWCSILFLFLFYFIYGVRKFYTWRQRCRNFDCFYFRSTPKLGERSMLEAYGIAKSYRNPSFKGNLGERLTYDRLVNFTLLDLKSRGLAEFGNDTLTVDVTCLEEYEATVIDYLALKDLHEIALIWGLGSHFESLTSSDGNKLTIHFDNVDLFLRRLKNCVKNKIIPRGWMNEEEKKYAGLETDERLKLTQDLLTQFNQPTYRLCEGRSDKKRKISLVGLLTLLISAFSAVFLFFDTTNVMRYTLFIPLILVAGGFISCILFSQYRTECSEQYSEDDLELTKQIIGLENWIRDFTYLQNKQYSEDIVWGDFVKWATLMGMMKNAESMVAFFDVNVFDESDISPFEMFDAILNILSYSTIISTSATTVSSVASRGGSGGGGFAGGGGGGGGGGGR